VDGFSIDVLWQHGSRRQTSWTIRPKPHLSASDERNAPILQLHSTDQPEVHGIAADMRAIADKYAAKGRGERVLIGEIDLPLERCWLFAGKRAGATFP